MRLPAKIYIGLILIGGAVAVYHAVLRWHSDDMLRFVCNLAVCVLVSGFKVNLPGIKGTMSVNFLLILLGVSQMSLGETMALGCGGTLVQCFWKAKNPVKPVRLAFSLATMAVAITASYAFTGLLSVRILPAELLAISVVYFFMNTAPIAGVIALTEGKPLAQTWHRTYFWSFPFYVVGASITWLLSLVSRNYHWLGSLLLIPVLYVLYRFYHVYLGRLEDEKRHAEEVANLHMRTIEALALAIEAKDEATHEHLRRVRTYVEEIGKALQLPEIELEALRAAALLHDIGKLAVPEHILSKPGKMTAEEFEKMKIHPIVGAEILECVGFPCPVAPIVEAHHEKWDGTGYPFGLKGEDIPIGARILAAVDALDALASDRQYRRALPLDEAMAQVEELSGKSFDPRVVQALKVRYPELEAMAQAQPLTKPRLSKGIKIGRGLEPAAGLEVSADKEPRGFLDSIASARQEVRLLFELTRELGTSLSLDETVSVVGVRLKRLIPYDAIAVYILRDGYLVPEYVNGEDFRLFSSLKIPMGQGLSGWVAQNRKPILNGNPSVECAYLKDPTKFSTMGSGLAAPLEGLNGAVGILTLYRAGKDAFSRDNLRILLAISAKVSLSIENALKFRQAEDSATTDYLTNLPNSRALFTRLEAELARCRRERGMLTLLVCDLNGFKQINDRYGHLEGNRLLRDISEALRANCREYDYVARMGGDEFVLLLLGNDQTEIGDRIEQLKSIEWRAGAGAEERVSMSVGAAMYPADGSDADLLLAAADRRMYKAKQERKMWRAVNTADAGVAVVAIQ